MSYKKSKSKATNKVQRVNLSAQEIIDSFDKLNGDNFRLTPVETAITQSGEIPYLKQVWLLNKAERDDDDIKMYKYSKPALEKDASDIDKLKYTWLPDNTEVYVQDGDEYVYMGNQLNKIVTISPLTQYKKKDGKKDTINRYATISFISMDREAIEGGDYSPQYTDDMNDEQKGEEEKRVRELVSTYAHNSQLNMRANICIDTAYRRFGKKMCIQGLYGCKADTKINSFIQYFREPEDPKTKKTTIVMLEQPIAKLKIQFHTYDPKNKKHKKSKLSQKLDKRVGQFYITNSDGVEVFKPILFDGTKKGKDVELRYKSRDDDGNKVREFVTTENMHKAVPAKSLVTGHTSFIESTVSNFGLSLKAVVQQLYIRRHKSEPTMNKVDRSLIDGMADLDNGVMSDSDDEYEAPSKPAKDGDNDKSKSKSKGKDKVNFKKGKNPMDDDDSGSDDDNKSKNKKSKKKKDDSDDSDKSGSDDDNKSKNKRSKKKKNDSDDSDQSGSDDDSRSKSKDKKGKKKKKNSDDSDKSDSDDDSRSKSKDKKSRNKKKNDSDDDSSQSKGKNKKKNDSDDDSSQSKGKNKKKNDSDDGDGDTQTKSKDKNKKKSGSDDGDGDNTQTKSKDKNNISDDGEDDTQTKSKDKKKDNDTVSIPEVKQNDDIVHVDKEIKSEDKGKKDKPAKMSDTDDSDTDNKPKDKSKGKSKGKDKDKPKDKDNKKSKSKSKSKATADDDDASD